MNIELLESSLPFNSGDLYDASKIKESVEKIKNSAELSGYSFIDITPRLENDQTNQVVNIKIEVDEGPRVYVNEIDISGNTRTIDKVIRREFSLTEGDAYNK